MPTYATSQEWLRLSSQLIEAAPTTTRITTKYHIETGKRRKRRAAASTEGTAGEDAGKPAQGADPVRSQAPRGHLVLKTFDPSTGVVLKYRTSKAAEVSRLVQMLGSLARRMAALPAKDEDETMADAPAAAAPVEAATSGTQTPTTAQPAQQGQPGAGGGGKGGKKKKGKR